MIQMLPVERFAEEFPRPKYAQIFAVQIIELDVYQINL